MEPKSDETRIALIDQKLDFVAKDVADIKQSIRDQYVSRAEFDTLNAQFKIVRGGLFGLTGIVVTALVITLVNVITKGGVSGHP